MTKIVLKNLLYCCCIIIALAFINTAKAEDQDYGSTYKNPQAQTSNPNDQQYKMPNYYNGKYYPDDESVIGYHGTTNSAQNDKMTNGNGYYYYYY